MVQDKFIDVLEIYSKKSEIKPEDVKQLQEWAETQPHLPKITELEMILFLHSCNGSSGATKECIDTFYTLRTHSPEFFKNYIPSKTIFDTMFYTTLPKLTKDGYTVLIGHFTNSNVGAFKFDEVIKAMDMSLTLSLRQNGPTNGLFLLNDLTGLSVGHLTKINLLHMKKFFMYLQEGLPVRLKGLHFINIVPFIDKVMALIKPFLKEELKHYIYFHENLKAMQEFIELDCLPENYGGQAASLEELKNQRLESFNVHKDFFVDFQGKLVDEAKRPGKPKSSGDIFGIEGTFKKLDID